MVYLIKYLLYKHKDLSLNPGTHIFFFKKKARHRSSSLQSQFGEKRQADPVQYFTKGMLIFFLQDFISPGNINNVYIGTFKDYTLIIHN